MKDFFPEKILIFEIIELISEKNTFELRDLTKDFYPVDIANIIGEIDNIQDKIFLLTLRNDIAFIIDVFEELSAEDQENIIENLKDPRLVRNILNEMASDDRADFFSAISHTLSVKLKKKLNPLEKADLEELLKYEEESAGGLMTTDYITLDSTLTVEHAIREIREHHKDAETISYEFVVDAENHLMGMVTIRDLIFATPDITLEDMMTRNVIFTYSDLDQEVVASLFRKYDVSVMPVVDLENHMIGIITIDDILDVMEEETTEDIQKIGASLPLDESYFDTSIPDLIKKRFIWLCVLLLVGTVTSNILKAYDSVLAAMIALSYFVPIITGTGGNTGTQSATMIIRGIALGEVSFKDIYKVLLKELTIGFLMGVMLAVLGFIQSFITTGILIVSATLALSLMFTTVASACVGGVLPIVAKRFGMDPAVMSGPFISTVVDIGGLLIYLQTASLIIAYFA
ncbi:MAG: magnesium transporter [Candidatus Muiribacteriaceae bacterium]